MGWPCQPSEHDADHGEADEGDDGSGVALEITRQPAAAADPGEGSFDDPAFRHDLETGGAVAPLDHLDPPRSGLCRGRGRFRPLIAAIGEDPFDEGELATGSLIEHQRDAVTILDVGRVNGDVQQQAERVDQDVPLASLDLLSRVVALRVQRRAPF